MVALRIALRYLFAKKSHSAVNVISIISVVGVALASMSIVCILSVFNGFTDLALKQVSVLAPDLLIVPRDGKVIAASDSVCAALMGIDGVVVAASVVEERALGISGSRQMPLRIKGVSGRYAEMNDIAGKVKEDGSFLLYDSVAGDLAVLSVGVALDLEARPTIPSVVELYVPRRVGRINPANPTASFRSDTLIVSGVYQTEHAETDADGVIVGIDVARRLLGYFDEATAIEVEVGSADVGRVAADIRALLGDGVIVKDRIAQDEASFRMIAIEKWVTFCMMAFILIIASFNVVSTLSMLIIEKDGEVRTLMAFGATRSGAVRVFMIEGWLISFFGGLVGAVIGMLLCCAQQIWGFIKLGGDHEMMTTDVYPVSVSLGDIGIVLILVAIVGLCTSLLTAWFARSRFSISIYKGE